MTSENLKIPTNETLDVSVGYLESTNEQLTIDLVKGDSNKTVQNDADVLTSSLNIPTCSTANVQSNQEISIYDYTEEISESISITNNETDNEQVSTSQVKINSDSVIDQTSTDNVTPCSSGSTANTADDQETKPQRDKCQYGGNCYRHNSDHKKEFSHPGDSDYESDPNDTRPRCRYGNKCYRKNIEHRKKYRHSGINSKQIPKGGHTRKKRNCTKNTQAVDSDSSENEYDFEDPFLNDDSDDAYNEESWSETDTSDDSIDPNNTNENDSEDTTTLVKEAKRFTKRKR